MKIGIQGGKASYHERATRQMHPEATIAYYETFPEVFAALRRQEVDSIIIAIANNSVGFIPEPYAEIVADKSFSIIGETYLPIKHALLALPGSKFEEINEVHSQSPALEQCRQFLDKEMNGVHIVEEHDTAGSAKLVAEWKDNTKAAIASEEAGRLYGLVTIRPHIQDDPKNITRFLEVVKGTVSNKNTTANKTTMLLETPQKPGALVDALLPFKQHGINLSNVHSRFIPNTRFKMMFFVEFEAGLWEEHTQQILKELQGHGYKTSILGTYQQAVLF